MRSKLKLVMKEVSLDDRHHRQLGAFVDKSMETEERKCALEVHILE